MRISTKMIVLLLVVVTTAILLLRMRSAFGW